ncbi:hypothetical protein Tco_0375199 [Tanacetum coccineum]
MQVAQVMELTLSQRFLMSNNKRLRGDSDEDDDNEDDLDNDSDDNDEKYDDEFNIKEEEKIADEESMNEEEDDEVTKELYGDVNVNLGNEDTDMINADQGLTQSSSVSFDFTIKLLNLDNPSPADIEIASLMDTTTQYTTAILEITSSFTTTVPPPPSFFNPLQ